MLVLSVVQEANLEAFSLRTDRDDEACETWSGIGPQLRQPKQVESQVVAGIKTLAGNCSAMASSCLFLAPRHVTRRSLQYTAMKTVPPQHREFDSCIHPFISTVLHLRWRYKFFFDDGSSVVVLSVPWMKTLEVLEAKDVEPKDA